MKSHRIRCGQIAARLWIERGGRRNEKEDSQERGYSGGGKGIGADGGGVRRCGSLLEFRVGSDDLGLELRCFTARVGVRVGLGENW